MSVSQTFDLLFLLTLLVFILVGIFRGFIKSFVGSARLILSVALAYAFGGVVGELLNSALIGGWIENGVFGFVDGMIGDAASDAAAEQILSAFPQFLIGDASREAVNEAFATQSGASLSAAVTTAIAEPIAAVVSGILGYATVFLLSLLLCRLVAWAGTSVVDRIAPLRFFNRLFGGTWGALTGALLLLTVAAIVKLFFRETEVYTDTSVVRWFADSPFLSFLDF